MTHFDFTDRPSSERIKATSEEYYDIEPELVLSFLEFQWSYREMQKQYDYFLRKFNLSESKFIILMFLKRAEDNKLLPSEIALKLGASRPTVSKILHGMEKMNLIRKSSSTVDKRSSYFQLTEVGEQTLIELMPYNFSAVKTIFGKLNSEDLIKFNELLSKINSGTKKLEKELEC
ncbi:MarR family winged helix-turn-helix transcriptional regulator [Carnobacterium maltaromaticum]|uniref:MarR family winged helix-turn-helix transcriptional regulator n=1 Tax=Carnobacterium maltaromaticum TaxID=2751 RepID=UPI00191BC02C|nr:MarR family transcriptional regulator [Carnobacterium maltaromaticum]CAD5903285.1 Transcriptional regulator MarR family [Carnobacterium maltaromaticum]